MKRFSLKLLFVLILVLSVTAIAFAATVDKKATVGSGDAYSAAAISAPSYVVKGKTTTEEGVYQKMLKMSATTTKVSDGNVHIATSATMKGLKETAKSDLLAAQGQITNGAEIHTAATISPGEFKTAEAASARTPFAYKDDMRPATYATAGQIRPLEMIGAISESGGLHAAAIPAFGVIAMDSKHGTPLLI